MKRLLLIVLPLLLIVGCSQKPVDETTLIEKDGVMYLPNSEKPYTGEVFTNYPIGEKLYQGTYEYGLLVQYSYLNKDGSVKEPVNIETLIDRGGNLYDINGQKPYTGDIFGLYSNGNKKLSGSLKGGKIDGLTTYWYENGQKKSEGTSKDGEPDGLYTEWYENGQKSIEGTSKDGEPDGLYTEWYENGQKSIEGTYKGVDESMDPIKDGLWTEWYENGLKEKEVTYLGDKKMEEKIFIQYSLFNEKIKKLRRHLDRLQKKDPTKSLEEIYSGSSNVLSFIRKCQQDIYVELLKQSKSVKVTGINEDGTVESTSIKVTIFNEDGSVKE